MTATIPVLTVEQLLEQGRSTQVLMKGDTYKDLSTVIIKAIPGEVVEKKTIVCDCGKEHHVEKSRFTGLHPVVVDAWQRLIKPMNVPVVEMLMVNQEVGDAYTNAIDAILANPMLAKFKYILTLEHDNIIPFMPNSKGPLFTLYEDIESGFDVAGGLYWTKGVPSMPLLYGDPTEVGDSPAGMFKVRMDWQDQEPGPIECNGLGMGFTLFKLDLFKDPRFERPWFKTVTENNDRGPMHYTQDLFFFEKVRKLGYRVCVDTRVRVGHMDLNTGRVF